MATAIKTTGLLSGAIMACLSVSALAQVPTLVSPVNGATNVPIPVSLDWDDLAMADRYHVQVSPTSLFVDLRYDEETKESEALAGLSYGTQYYWRVRGGIDTLQTTFWGDWSAIWSFSTCPIIPPAPVLIYPSEGLTVAPGRPEFTWHSVPEPYLYDIEVYLHTIGGDSLIWSIVQVDTVRVSPDFLDFGHYRWRVQNRSQFCGYSEFAEVQFWVGWCCDIDGIKGDADTDCTFGCITVSDVTYLVAYLFQGGPAPMCCDEANADSDCTFGCITVSDLTYLVVFLFQSGPQPQGCGDGHQCADFGQGE